MQLVSDQIASRSELLELAETLGIYARFEQTQAKQRRSVGLMERAGRLSQLAPLQSEDSVGFRLENC